MGNLGEWLRDLSVVGRVYEVAASCCKSLLKSRVILGSTLVRPRAGAEHGVSRREKTHRNADALAPIISCHRRRCCR